jgi:hypothetical protein
MTPLFEGTAGAYTVLLALVPTICLAWLAAFIATRLARRALQSILGDQLSTASPLVRGPLRLVGLTTFVLCVSLMLFPAFELVGLRPRTGVPLKTIAEWAFRHGLKIVLIGVVFGIALAFAITRLMQRLLFEVKTTDPLTFAGVALLLVIIALLACLIPARRASKVDPMEALRYE